jgi:hypothetical protein
VEDLKLKCNCGKVTGVVRNVEPSSGNRLVCYCQDCRNFAEYCNYSDDILNEFGGTDIFQIHPSNMTISHGLESVTCLRFSEKGLYRWFTSCCQTPVGNTAGLHLPFVGLIHSFIASDQNVDSKIGPVIGSVYTEQATGNPSDKLTMGKSKVGLLFRIIGKLFIWKVLGKGSPNPFFDKNGNPIVEPNLVHHKARGSDSIETSKAV